MPEQDSSEIKQFYEDLPQRNEAFFLKGAGAYDWGMQHRLAQIFRPESGHTVMLAIDHGYFQGRPPASSVSTSTSCRWRRKRMR